MALAVAVNLCVFLRRPVLLSSVALFNHMIVGVNFFLSFLGLVELRELEIWCLLLILEHPRCACLRISSSPHP